MGSVSIEHSNSQHEGTHHFSADIINDLVMHHLQDSTEKKKELQK